ncbi:MAG: hypothetical protein CM1200mP4_3030 [Rhodospirillaceae bacterium]|nr:MAG: hypothetical protein CM1200mP4_3030 [Rhodospirillaceae bacterium]
MGIVTDVILPLALAFIMFSLGLGFTLEDFSRVVKQPRDFFLGLYPKLSSCRWGPFFWLRYGLCLQKLL